MITGGNATVYVSNMDRAVDFHVQTLGLKLAKRYGNHWAEVEAPGLLIGLHPKTERTPSPGAPGSIQIGLTIDEPIDDVVRRLAAKGVAFTGPVLRDDQGGIAMAFFGDPDGNVFYLCQVTRSW